MDLSGWIFVSIALLGVGLAVFSIVKPLREGKALSAATTLTLAGLCVAVLRLLPLPAIFEPGTPPPLGSIEILNSIAPPSFLTCEELPKLLLTRKEDHPSQSILPLYTKIRNKFSGFRAIKTLSPAVVEVGRKFPEFTMKRLGEKGGLVTLKQLRGKAAGHDLLLVVGYLLDRTDYESLLAVLKSVKPFSEKFYLAFLQVGNNTNYRPLEISDAIDTVLSSREEPVEKEFQLDHSASKPPLRIFQIAEDGTLCRLLTR